MDYDKYAKHFEFCIRFEEISDKSKDIKYYKTESIIKD